MDSKELPESLIDTCICVDGELRPPDEPHLLAYDRGILYGDGIYDSLPVYDNKALFIDRHINRLYQSAQAARIDIPVSKDRIKEWILKTLNKSLIEYGGCRIVITRGVGKQGMRNTDVLNEPTIVIIPSREDEEKMAYGQLTTEVARIVSTRTIPPDSVDPKLKGLNYLDNILAERELVGTDATAGIMLDQQGRVAEAFDANIFIIDDNGKIRTPDTVNSLAGITRAVVLECLDDAGYEHKIGAVTPAELFSSQDVFLTGSGVGVSHVVELNGQSLGKPSETATNIAEKFRNVATSSEYETIDSDK